MIRELTLHDFRAFRTLHLSGLGRVNLLVGSNNSGKTSVLEAVHFHASGGDVMALFASLVRRGERTSNADPDGYDEALFDIRHALRAIR